MVPLRHTFASLENSLRKPLIVRLRNYIGDVVLSMPALEALAANGFERYLVCKPWAKDLLAAYDWPVSTYPSKLVERVALFRELRKHFRTHDSTFDQRLNALTFVTAFSSALEMRIGGLKTVGYTTEARSWLLSRSTAFDASRHAIDLYWDIAKRLHNNQAPPPDAASLRIHLRHEAEKNSRLLSAGVKSDYVVLVPYPGGEIDGVSKKWSEFRALVAPLISTGLKLVMAPSPSEIAFTNEHYPEAISLPNLSLGAYAALVRDAALTISNDTGPGHIAASVEGRLLSILGPTKQSQWGARGPRVTILQETTGWPTAQTVVATALDIVNNIAMSKK
jgi:heptosyltransferase II